jgi:hypothetical protein
MIVILPASITNSLPIPVLCILFVAVMVSTAQAGLWLFNRWHRHLKQQPGNEVTGIVFGAISLIYSLILAFVIVAVWGDYNDTEKAIQAEIDKMNSILSHSSTLPEGLRENFGRALYNYCGQVIHQEWKMQSINIDHPSAIPALRLMLLTTQPANEVQERIFDSVDKDLSSISDLRRQRLLHTHSQIPSLIWQILGAGTVLMIVFSYFLDTSSLRLKQIYLGFLVASISMCMFLVYRLDRPFDGKNGVSNEPYLKVQQEINDYLSSNMVLQLSQAK